MSNIDNYIRQFSEGAAAEIEKVALAQKKVLQQAVDGLRATLPESTLEVLAKGGAVRTMMFSDFAKEGTHVRGLIINTEASPFGHQQTISLPELRDRPMKSLRLIVIAIPEWK